jgi:hypothetical protein
MWDIHRSATVRKHYRPDRQPVLVICDGFQALREASEPS